MATTTKRGLLTSPFCIADPKESLKVYNKMPHMQRVGAVPLTLAQYKPIHKKRYTPESTEAPVQASSDASDTLAQLVAQGASAEVIAAVANALGITKAPKASTKTFRARLAVEDRPEDAATNRLLWALNTEGCLTIAPKGNAPYITQEQGKTTMTAIFGPLVKA